MKEVILFLAAAIVFVPIAARLKLGSVLGYLVAGCAIGPFGLRLVADVHSILHLSELGVVLMLFLIGLELDVRRLWAMRGPVFGGGALQMGACGIVLAVGALLLTIPWRGALVAGLALALSSTAIAIQTMRERGVLTAPVGKASFALLLFQDIAAIPLIAVVPLLAPEDATAPSGSSGPMGVLKALGAIAFVIVFGRYLTTPLLRFVARTGLREVFTAFALLLVLGIAEVMALANVSMALGAFLAGVLLASSEYRHALETDIEPFKGLLMGLFFMSVGMSIDFGLLREHAPLVALLVVGLVAIKGLLLAFLATRIGVPAKERWLLALLLSQGGEFAFVVFGAERSAHLLEPPWDGLLNLAVALSMATTPIGLLLYDRFSTRDRAEVPFDTIETDHNPVIIAGFGRFGQIVGRLLLASGIKPTILDFNPEGIETMRKFDFRVFFGDATRLDLLHSARADEAKVLVVAIDDVGSSLKLVDIAREHFPHLEIVARARNVTHLLELRARGVKRIERETFESSLRAGRHVMEALGDDPFEAREDADRFRQHNLAMLEQLLPYLRDEKTRFSLARAGREQLEHQVARERDMRRATAAGGWSEPASREPAPAEQGDP